MDNLTAIMQISGSGMHAQQSRINIIAQNVANANSTGSTPGAEPYRRQTISFEEMVDRKTGAALVKVKSIDEDQSEFAKKYEPTHPAADPNTGYVLYPNVNSLIEVMDSKEASRSYEANLNMFDTGRKMKSATIDLLK